MNAALSVFERSTKYIARPEPPLIRNFDSLVSSNVPGGLQRLRTLVQTLAVRGLLLPQEAGDESATELLERISAPISSATAPYGLPSGWAWARFGDVVENMGSGWSPACDEGERRDARHWAVLKTTAVQVMRYLPNEHKTLPVKFAPRPSIEVKRGDILITRAGPMNRVGVCCAVSETPERLMLSDKIVRAHAIDDEMLPSFLVLALNAGWSRARIESAKTGMAASQVNISQSDLRSIPVPICSLPEQHRIVARVEELMKLCDALEQSGRLADEQHARLTSTLFDDLAASESAHALAENWQCIAEHFDLLLDRPEAIDTFEQTILQLAVRGLLVPQDAREMLALFAMPQLQDSAAMFSVPASWRWTSLESVLASGPNNGFSPKPSLTGTVRCLTLSATTKGYFRDDCHKLIDIDASTSAQYFLKQGDLLIQRANSLEHVGIAAIYDGRDDEYTFPDLMMRMRVLPSIACTPYIHLWLVSTDGRSYLRSKATGTQGNMPKVNQGTVRQVPVPLPPLAEQHRIVARVEELRRLCTQLRDRLTEARRTQSLLADALVQQVTNTPSASAL